MLICQIGSVVFQVEMFLSMLVSSQNSYVEVLTPGVMVLGGRALRGHYVVRVEPSQMRLVAE